MNMPFISSLKGKIVFFIRGFATPEICTIALLDEINGIFIPKM